MNHLPHTQADHALLKLSIFLDLLTTFNSKYGPRADDDTAPTQKAGFRLRHCPCRQWISLAASPEAPAHQGCGSVQGYRRRILQTPGTTQAPALAQPQATPEKVARPNRCLLAVMAAVFMLQSCIAVHCAECGSRKHAVLRLLISLPVALPSSQLPQFFTAADNIHVFGVAILDLDQF